MVRRGFDRRDDPQRRLAGSRRAFRRAGMLSDVPGCCGSIRRRRSTGPKVIRRRRRRLGIDCIEPALELLVGHAFPAGHGRGGGQQTLDQLRRQGCTIAEGAVMLAATAPADPSISCGHRVFQQEVSRSTRREPCINWQGSHGSHGSNGSNGSNGQNPRGCKPGPAISVISLRGAAPCRVARRPS